MGDGTIYNIYGSRIKVISKPCGSETRSTFDIIFFNIYEPSKSDVFSRLEEPAGLKQQLPQIFPDSRIILASSHYVTTVWLEQCEVCSPRVRLTDSSY